MGRWMSVDFSLHFRANGITIEKAEFCIPQNGSHPYEDLFSPLPSPEWLDPTYRWSGYGISRTEWHYMANGPGSGDLAAAPSGQSGLSRWLRLVSVLGQSADFVEGQEAVALCRANG